VKQGSYRPVILQFTRDNVGVVLLSQGIVSGPELTNAVKSVYASPRFEQLKYWISDMSGRTEFLPSTDEINRLVEMDKVQVLRNPDMVIIFVAKHKLEYGLARMVQLMSEDKAYKTMVFSDRSEADCWLKDNLGCTVVVEC